MIKNIFRLFLLTLLLGATPAKAVIMEVDGVSVEVGGLDNLLFSTYFNGGATFEDEVAALESFLNLPPGTLDMNETLITDDNGTVLDSDHNWTQIFSDSDSFLTYDFGANSDSIYYMLEIVSGGEHHSNYYFDNQDDLQYAFISVSDMFDYGDNTPYNPSTNFVGDFYFDVKRITSVATVPEPAMLSLLGAGLIGMGLARRRIRK